jgi:hypothetical protein
MPDQPKGPQGKAQKGAGGKDQKLTKRNKNVTSSLSDRTKDAKLEADVTREMQEVQETVFEPWQLRVIELQSQGWSFEKIIEEGENKRKQMGTARPGMRRVLLPSRTTLFKAVTSHPEFREACEKSYSFAVDSEAQRTLELAKSLDREHESLLEMVKAPDLTGLDPVETVKALVKFAEARIPVARDWVNARDKRIQRTLQVAGRIMPDKWGEQAEADREVIVFEPYGGWLPQNTATGVPGQGAEADSAAAKWRKMREEAKDV